MANQGSIKWPGQSGKEYLYYIHDIGAIFSNETGNYIFAKKNLFGEWTPVYIGETDDLASRFANHEKWPCIQGHGATHIHAHTNGNASARLSEETDLRHKWSTPCNEQ